MPVKTMQEFLEKLDPEQALKEIAGRSRPCFLCWTRNPA